MATVRLTQHAVGQGGLCSGEVQAGDKLVRWIYDCGSNQTDCLEREIHRISTERIDLLFLSHLDKDHVNGIDLLLGNREVKEVVLPYLESAKRVLVVGEEAAAGRLTETFRSFIADPVKWLHDRGVNKITFVRTYKEDDDIPLAEPPETGPLDIPGEIKVEWNREPKPISRGWGKGGRVAEPGTMIGLKSEGASAFADWVFIPQVHLPTAARAQAFQKALRREFPGKKNDEIVRSALNPMERPKLRKAYDTLSKDHNKITMSLYVGCYPSSKSKWVARFDWRSKNGLSDRYFLYCSTGSDSGKVGWLSSGDADLSASGRRNAFLNFYRQVLPSVRVFILPHHGSAASFHADLLAGMQALRIAIAAAGPNRYGHPDEQVREAVNKACLFIQVDEREPSSFICTLQSMRFPLTRGRE